MCRSAKLMVLTAEVHQRRALVRRPVLNLTQHDDVVAAGIQLLHLALDPGQNPIKDRRARRRPIAVGNALKLVRELAGEATRELLLIARQDVDDEPLALLDGPNRLRAQVYTDQAQPWFERHRAEGTRGEPTRDPIRASGGDDGDAAGKRCHQREELLSIDWHP